MPGSDERFTAREIKALREGDSAQERAPERVLSPKERLDSARKDLGDGIQTACGMDYEEWCMAWKTLKTVFENASGADVAESYKPCLLGLWVA